MNLLLPIYTSPIYRLLTSSRTRDLRPTIMVCVLLASFSAFCREDLRRQTKGSKIEGKMATKWHGFMATDPIQNPALMPKYTTILHVAKAGRGLRVYAERLESPTEAGWAHLSVEMCPNGYPLRSLN